MPRPVCRHHAAGGMDHLSASCTSRWAWGVVQADQALLLRVDSIELPRARVTEPHTPLSDARVVDTLAPGLTLALRRVTITERSSSWTLGRMHECVTAQRGLMHLKDLHYGHRAPRGARGRRARSGDHGHGARHPGDESAALATRTGHLLLSILKKSARAARWGRTSLTGTY